MGKKKTTDDLPPWMGGKGVRKDRNRRSAKQERERAEEISGRAQAGSGSSRRAPQDVRGQVPLQGGAEGSEEVLEQLKFTDKDTTTVDARELARLRDDALRSGCEPSYVIEFSKHGLRLVGRVERIPRRR